MNWKFRLPILLLLSALVVGCASRAPHDRRYQEREYIPDGVAMKLVSLWQGKLLTYISEQGRSNPVILLRTREQHARERLRPARISFGAMNLQAGTPDRNGWDANGLLVGSLRVDQRDWYIFVVGLIRREDYRPLGIQEIRPVALIIDAGRAYWKLGAAAPEALARYKRTFPETANRLFPGESDNFKIEHSGFGLRIKEVRSGAVWPLFSR